MLIGEPLSNQKPGLFCINYSNRDFSRKEAWGKNCFNSTFPAALSAFIQSCGLENIYLKLDSSYKVVHSSILTSELYGLAPNSNNLFYAFETQFTPYQQYLIGSLPRVDLVLQARDTGACLRPLEVKLTALPDRTTCNLSESLYGCELVIRPDTIVYLACMLIDGILSHNIPYNDLLDPRLLSEINGIEFDNVLQIVPALIEIIDRVAFSLLDYQKPLLLQPVWKTEGKSPKLSENCLDVFVWSDLAFTRLFVDLVKTEIQLSGSIRLITRPVRTLIWLFKMLSDFCNAGNFNAKRIIDNLSYNTKNDKAFAVSGSFTNRYMKCSQLECPRITKYQIQQIVLGGGQNLLSPERRFDAIIYNSPDLFT
ncbi:HindVP family restriction endonuclease [Oscillatoria sp. FACHB-1406]|uniref:HindVP family restriction endonuclease n=1 Tax=Oscillatoria sp. FACHB-1406 TaxID=2692846 RepID=UPI0032208585